jgi:hypothetical protein
MDVSLKPTIFSKLSGVLFAGLLLNGLAGRIEAAVLFSFSGTYSPYTVSISFNTSLAGAQLDDLTLTDITPSVSGFSETNTIPGNILTPLLVKISTDSLGHITAFDITDTQGQEVTNTTDTGPGTPGTVYSPPATDLVGNTLQFSNVQNGDELFGYYGYGIGYCVWNTSTGQPSPPGNTDPYCPTAAIGSPGIIPGPSVSGNGIWISNPADPGAVSAPEPISLPMVGSGLALLAFLRLRRSVTGTESVRRP